MILNKGLWRGKIMKNIKHLSFRKDSPEKQILLEWWRKLEDNRGDRAELRHCKNLIEVAFTPAYHRLRLELMQYGNVDNEGLALVAGLLSHVKPPNDGTAKFAEQMAQSKNTSESAKVSGLRFRRLLKIKTKDKLFPALIRIISLLGNSANLISLAESVYYWNENTRKKWAFDYYSKSPAEA